MDRKALSYVGAIIDGEGSIFISKIITKSNKLNLRLNISVANTCKELISFLDKRFKGNVTKINSKQANRQNYWVWRIWKNEDIIIFLEKIIPYLIIKRKQGELALEFAKSRLNILKKPRNELHYKNSDYKIYEQIKELKKNYPIETPKINFTKEEKWHYLAGLIDGEGSVRIAKATHTNIYGNKKLILTPQISIGNTDKRMTNFLKKEFGGFIIKRKRKKEWKNIYEWIMQGVNKEEFYKKLVGKLVDKKKRLDVLLKYVESRKKNYTRENEIDLFLEMQKLNNKGLKNKYKREELIELTKLVRNPRKFFIEKEEIERLYLDDKLSIRQIAKKYNVKYNSVYQRMKKLDIHRRNLSEFHKISLLG